MLSKTHQAAKLQVILRPHVTLQVLEYPLATREYVGITGFYIRASKAMEEMKRVNLLGRGGGGDIAVQALTVAATHTTS